MIKNLTLLFLLAWMISCTTSKNTATTILFSKETSPPNMVRVSDNFYADITETSNINYREYLFWVKMVYSEKSISYQNALPKQEVWAIDDEYSTYVLKYLSDPKYNNYPVVGITLEQATNYTNWRTDRVVEMMLIQNGAIRVRPEQTPKDCFTVERYVSGQFNWKMEQQEMYLPKIRIPTEKEWKVLAKKDNQLVFGTDTLSRFNRKVKKERGLLHNTNEYYHSPKNFESGKHILATSEVVSFSKNEFGLYHLFGNVAEMVLEKESSKGGSWQHSIAESDIDQITQFKAPNCWTGFRNVCSWEKVVK